MCHVLAPKTPDSRVRWLAELTTQINNCQQITNGKTNTRCQPFMGKSPAQSPGMARARIN
ncbi:hypothetical protein Ciccas_000414 [Cichlidogyrus casuarinus]|uniref:PH domain-containing protein n=1 Tax=Cichlidogyrus casuarinus TaxID=1844966 RepID=A0ABD2QMX4_9PLAT